MRCSHGQSQAPTLIRVITNRDIAGLAGVAHDDRGAVLVEYALVLSLLSFAFVGGMKLVEQASSTALLYLQAQLQNYASGTL